MPPRRADAHIARPAGVGNLLFVSGHIARREGKPWAGQLGAELTTANGKAAPRAVAVDFLGTLYAATGDLDRVKRIVKLTVLVRADRGSLSGNLYSGGCRNSSCPCPGWSAMRWRATPAT